jgi:translation initiation factor 4E
MEDKETVSDGKVEMISPEDPNYDQTRTVLSDPENFSIKHPLQNSWTLWFDQPSKRPTADSWLESLKKIITFDTVCSIYFVVLC